MLSPLLEQLVLTNQATIKTHTHGIGGVGTINVPAGKKIIITQIIWNPFIDAVGVEELQEDVFDRSGSFLHTLKLRNKQSRYAYSFRDSFTPYVYKPKGGGEAKTIISPAEPTVIETYLPFTEGNIDIDIMKFTNFDAWIFTDVYVPENQLEPDPGEGYGNDNSVNKFITNGLARFYGFFPPPYTPTTYSPLGSRSNTPVPGMTFEFEGTLPLTLIPNNPQNTDLCMFPIVTFTYVEINTRYIPGQAGNVDFTKK